MVAGRERLVTPLFVLITVSAFAYFTSYGTIVPTLPRYVRGPLGGSDAAVGLAVGLLSFSAVMLRPLAGRLGDRRGRRILMVGGAAIAAASVAGFRWATTLPFLIALRLLGGAGEAMFFTGAASAINDIAPEARRGEAVSLFSLSLYAGLATGPLLGEAVLGAAGFASVWIVSASLAATGALIASKVPDTRPSGAAGGAYGSLLHPAAVLPGAVIATSIWAYAGFTSFMPLYALSLGLGGSRFVFLVFSLVILSVRLFGARIPDALGARRTASIAFAGSILGLALIAVWPRPAGLYLGAAVFAIGQSLAFPALVTLAVRRAPAHQRAAAVGTFTAFVDVGFGLGPVTLGVVARSFGYRAAFAGAGAVAAVGMTGLLLRMGAGGEASGGAGLAPTGEPGL
jgi:MFS family permease